MTPRPTSSRASTWSTSSTPPCSSSSTQRRHQRLHGSSSAQSTSSSSSRSRSSRSYRRTATPSRSRRTRRTTSSRLDIIPYSSPRSRIISPTSPPVCSSCRMAREGRTSGQRRANGNAPRVQSRPTMIATTESTPDCQPHSRHRVRSSHCSCICTVLAHALTARSSRYIQPCATVVAQSAHALRR